MEENKISKGKEILAILLLTMVIATGTFAWIVWSSKDNTKMNVTIGDLADVSFKTGNDINISNLSPSFYYDDGVLTEFSVRKKKGLTTELNTSIYLDITSISDELKNDNFKYVLLSSTDGNTYNEVISSSFKDASIGKLSIVTDTPLTDGKTYYKFYIWIDGNNENNETMQGRSMKASLNVKVATPTANFVEELDDGTTGDSGSGVYAVHHDTISAESSATGKEIPAVTDYRYYGPSPNNYIYLDADDFQLFRIIGSIYEENAGQNLLKVITATPLTDGTTSEFSWDYKSDGTYTNIWSSITNGVNSGSTLMQLLNGIYLMRGSGSYYNGNETATTVDFSSTGLTDITQALMNTGKDNNGLSRYYLGGFSDRYAKPADIYLSERNKTTSSGSALYWDGKVGLMYPSDYGYAAGNDCAINIAYYEYFDCSYNKNWLYNGNKWTMTPYSQSGVAGVYGGFGDAPSPDVLRNVHPVFYLKSDITLIGGTGTMDDPYLVQ